METTNTKVEKISQSITLKAIIIAGLTLLMLIPSSMIQNLITERDFRSKETIEKINSKWSNAQTVSGPVLVIPYTKKTANDKKMIVIENHTFNLTPDKLIIKSNMTTEERHYGIYKSILYKSILDISGNFKSIDLIHIDGEPQWEKAYLRLGISDLRGIAKDIDFEVNGYHFNAETGGRNDIIGQGLIIALDNSEAMQSGKNIQFHCAMNLNGSSSLNFVPIGRNTHVEVKGTWKSPGFIGNYSPEYKINENGFNANWNVLHYNRNIPEAWIDSYATDAGLNTFGVNLVDTVDHYQLNMRSAKYALMFISLTFVVFFFVEVLTKKRIHPIQYLLVGVALILFYSLLLSISEQMNFSIAYLIASIATISLIVIYTKSIFKNKFQTSILALLLCVLYIFLYVVLQLEDVALLIGSIGLFIILGVIMFISKKINWYRDEHTEKDIKGN